MQTHSRAGLTVPSCHTTLVIVRCAGFACMLCATRVPVLQQHSSPPPPPPSLALLPRPDLDRHPGAGADVRAAAHGAAAVGGAAERRGREHLCVRGAHARVHAAAAGAAEVGALARYGTAASQRGCLLWPPHAGSQAAASSSPGTLLVDAPLQFNGMRPGACPVALPL